uniref:Immunoglobulin V-set domain-containing protein n=1 Tax=Xiphophorus couchianus TaxID=32473 RepID=A0A3B5L1W7_9TELE
MDWNLQDHQTSESLETKRPRLVAAMAGDDVVLPCHLGVTVNPDELVVEWGRLDLNPRFVFMWFEGSENVNEKNIAYKGRTSVFTDRLRDGDVSLRLTAVKHSDNGRFRSNVCICVLFSCVLICVL